MAVTTTTDQAQSSAIPAPGAAGVDVALQTALNAVVLDSLRPVALGLGLLMAVMAVAHAFMLPPALAPTMVMVSGGTAALLLATYAVLGRRQVPPRLAHPLAVGIATLILVDNLTHLYLVSDPLQTTNLILLVIGCGFLLLSGRWLAVTLALTLAGWGIVVALVPGSPTWPHFGFALLTSTVLAVLVHSARLRSLRRLEWLRLQDDARKSELEAALRATEAGRRALETTVGVAQRIASILDLDELLNEVAELIKARYGYYFVGIFLLDESGTHVVARAGTGEAGRSLCRQSFRLKVGVEGLIGWAAAQRTLAHVNDVSQDGRYVQVDAVPDTRSEVALPLEVGETLLGVLDIQSERPGAFSAEDLPVLQSLAAQVAIAIENAFLFQIEQSRSRLSQTVYRVAQALSETLDLQTVLDLILTHLAEIVAYDRGSMMLREGDELEIVAAHGFPPGAQPLQIRVTVGNRRQDIFQEIYRSQQPLVIPNVQERPDWQHVPGLPPARAWMGLPLIREGEVIGMLSLTRESPDPFTGDEVALAVTFAGQAAIALHNAQLYDQIKRFNQQLEETVLELQRRTDALEDAYEQLERLDRTKSDFITVASHELRTPLTTLRGYSQMLLGDPLLKDDAFRTQIVSGIHSGAVRLHEIVDSMLDVVKIESQALQLHPEPLSISSLLASVCGHFESALAERSLSLSIEDGHDLPLIQADPDALRKVFYQLIANAIKYTPDGGKVTISQHVLSGSEAGSESTPEGWVEVIISDTGIGIDPRHRDLIFTKFFQTGQVSLHSSGKTKFKGGGPGLGLAIARGIVQAHGGRLWAESTGYSEVDLPGSHFHVILPLQPHKP